MTTRDMPQRNAFGCEVGDGRLDKDGYRFHGKTRAHIAAWEAANGSVPDGMVLDHLCANRACSRLSHLEAVTQRENSFRKQWSYRSRIEQCPRGHDMRLMSIVVPPSSKRGGNGRICRQCNQEGP